MGQLLSANTQAILLLTAPLLAGRGEASTEYLTPGEYKKLARHLHTMEKDPADLLAPDAASLLQACHEVIDDQRLQRLLARGFLLSQVVERWQTRAIWIVSRADAHYPKRLRERLKENAPAILYGCGEATILEMGGLAVVGSRNVDDALVEYTQNVGRLAALARQGLVSGGARGIDQAAMRGALEEGGNVIGVLADSLEKTAMNREHRDLLMDGHLVLISPYDPNAGFNIGNAMQRNKLIYALADAALVVSSDYEKGGTWAGAVEQLDKLKLVRVYIRSTGEMGDGLAALEKKGALLWPNPKGDDAFLDVFAPVEPSAETLPKTDLRADELSARVLELLRHAAAPRKKKDLAVELRVPEKEIMQCLLSLLEKGVVEKQTKPVRYSIPQASFFEPSELCKKDELGARH